MSFNIIPSISNLNNKYKQNPNYLKKKSSSINSLQIIDNHNKDNSFNLKIYPKFGLAGCSRSPRNSCIDLEERRQSKIEDTLSLNKDIANNKEVNNNQDNMTVNNKNSDGKTEQPMLSLYKLCDIYNNAFSKKKKEGEIINIEQYTYQINDKINEESIQNLRQTTRKGKKPVLKKDTLKNDNKSNIPPLSIKDKYFPNVASKLANKESNNNSKRRNYGGIVDLSNRMKSPNRNCIKDPSKNYRKYIDFHNNRKLKEKSCKTIQNWWRKVNPNKQKIITEQDRRESKSENEINEKKENPQNTEDNKNYQEFGITIENILKKYNRKDVFPLLKEYSPQKEELPNNIENELDDVEIHQKQINNLTPKDNKEKGLLIRTVNISYIFDSKEKGEIYKETPRKTDHSWSISKTENFSNIVESKKKEKNEWNEKLAITHPVNEKIEINHIITENLSLENSKQLSTEKLRKTKQTNNREEKFDTNSFGYSSIVSELENQKVLNTETNEERKISEDGPIGILNLYEFDSQNDKKKLLEGLKWIGRIRTLKYVFRKLNQKFIDENFGPAFEKWRENTSYDTMKKLNFLQNSVKIFLQKVREENNRKQLELIEIIFKKLQKSNELKQLLILNKWKKLTMANKLKNPIECITKNAKGYLVRKNIKNLIKNQKEEQLSSPTILNQSKEQTKNCITTEQKEDYGKEKEKELLISSDLKKEILQQKMKKIMLRKNEENEELLRLRLLIFKAKAKQACLDSNAIIIQNFCKKYFDIRMKEDEKNAKIIQNYFLNKLKYSPSISNKDYKETSNDSKSLKRRLMIMFIKYIDRLVKLKLRDSFNKIKNMKKQGEGQE